MNDTIIMLDRDGKTRIVEKHGRDMTYHQNDTVIIVMNGKVEIVDKQSFRDILNFSAEDIPVAESLLGFFKVN